MPRDQAPAIDDRELDENPFYLDADGNPQVRDVGGFAPSDESDDSAPDMGDASAA